MLPLRTILSRASRTYLTISRQVNNLAQKKTISSAPAVSQITPSPLVSSPLVRHYSSTPSLETIDEDSSLEQDFVNDVERKASTKRQISAIMADYETFKSEGSMSVTKYHDLIGELAWQYKFDECMSLLNDMKAAGTADAKAYSYAIAAGRPGLLFHEVRFLFGEPLDGRAEETSPDSRNVSANFPIICKLMEEMKNKNMDLDMSFYDDIAASLDAGRQAGLLINVSLSLEKRGVTPSIKFYNHLLHTLPSRGFMQRAASLYERLVARGMAVYSTHMIRIHQLVTNGRLDDGLALYKQIHEKTAPNRVAFNILINGYLRNGRLSDALKVYADMKKSGNPDCQPDQYTIGSFLNHYYNTLDLEGASDILGEMQATGFPRTASEYGLLIRLNARYDPSQALKLLQEAISKNLHCERMAYDITRIVIDKRVLNEWKGPIHDAFLEAFGRKASSLNLDAPLCKMLLERPATGSTFSTFRDMVRELAALIEEKGWSANTAMMEYMLRRMIIQNDMAPLNDIANYLSEKRIPTTWNLKNLLIQCYLTSGDQKSAQNLIDSLVRRRNPLTRNSVKLMEQHSIPVPIGVRVLGTKQEHADTFSARSRQRQANPNFG